MDKRIDLSFPVTTGSTLLKHIVEQE